MAIGAPPLTTMSKKETTVGLLMRAILSKSGFNSSNNELLIIVPLDHLLRPLLPPLLLP
jgi:hypothetical protein